jgi:hypothetical protein
VLAWCSGSFGTATALGRALYGIGSTKTPPLLAASIPDRIKMRIYLFSAYVRLAG